MGRFETWIPSSQRKKSVVVQVRHPQSFERAFFERKLQAPMGQEWGTYMDPKDIVIY